MHFKDYTRGDWLVMPMLPRHRTRLHAPAVHSKPMVHDDNVENKEFSSPTRDHHSLPNLASPFQGITRIIPEPNDIRVATHLLLYKPPVDVYECRLESPVLVVRVGHPTFGVHRLTRERLEVGELRQQEPVTRTTTTRVRSRHSHSHS